MNKSHVPENRESTPTCFEPVHLGSPAIPWTQLPDAKADSPLYHEWNHYRSAVETLLAEGHEGRFVLIKGESIIGIWDTRAEAKGVALRKYLMEPCLIQEVRRHQPVVRLPARLWPCQG
jgi:hypothetical protein